MENFLVQLAQFILSLSLLIVLHELGHFIPAKIFKTRVEKFYLFFDPWFSIFKKKIGQTEYGIGWLPLGGYVKISGMIDESMDKEQMKSPPQPYEFRSKPAWQRLIIMVGGVTVNVLLAFLIYALILFTWGKEYLPVQNLSYGVYPDSLLQEAGMQSGDRVLKVGAISPETLADANQEILFGGIRTLTVLRGGEELKIKLPADIDQQMLAAGKQSLLEVNFPVVVDSVLPNSNAMRAGLLAGDSIVEVNGRHTPYFYEMVYALRAHRGDTVALRVFRQEGPLTLSVAVDSNGTIGFAPTPPAAFLQTTTREYGLLESFPAGVRAGKDILVNYVRSLSIIFSSEGVKQVGGFGTIFKLYDDQWNWFSFWNMTALLSIILAVMNILPIPALDGGHVMFLLYEMVVGRPPAQKFMEYAQLAGIAILLTLLLYANGMDVFRWLSN